MTDRDQKLAGELPKFNLEDWRSLVSKALRGAEFEEALVSTTYDGLKIKPLYTLTDDLGADHAGIPGEAPLVRSRHDRLPDPPWDIRQLYAEPDIGAANRAIHDDLKHGSTSVLLQIAAPEQSGIVLRTIDDFKRVLDGVDIESVPIALQAGVCALEKADQLLTVWQDLSQSDSRVKGALNVDPLGTLVRCGGLPINLEQAFT
ncbi:MAG: methylmalonyl-CoA mutase family protein, partial [Methyloligellaceae bacterium]